MLSFYNNMAIKHTVLLQLEDQLMTCELRPIQVDDAVEIYASPGRPAIDYPLVAEGIFTQRKITRS